MHSTLHFEFNVGKALGLCDLEMHPGVLPSYQIRFVAVFEYRPPRAAYFQLMVSQRYLVSQHRSVVFLYMH